MEKVSGRYIANTGQFIVIKAGIRFIVTPNMYLNHEVYSESAKKALDIYGKVMYDALVTAKRKVIMYEERLKEIEKYEDKCRTSE